MSFLSEIAISLCCVSVLSALVDVLIPDNSMAKSIKMLSGAVLLIAMISPFSKNISFQISDYYYREYSADEVSQNITNNMAKGMANTVASEIDKILKEQNCEGDIKIIVDIKEDGCIDIKRAKIYIKDDNFANKQKLSDEIKNKLSIDVEFKE